MTATLLPALVMGLLGGAHCVTMCGGAATALCAGTARGARGLVYNVGRLVGYSALGMVAGAVGALPVGGPLDVVRFAFRGMAALCMLGVGLHLFGLPSFVGRLESLGSPLWRRLAPLARRLVPLRSSSAALAAGVLWALMPCGLLYGALALAATAGSAPGGAATMAAFALGTFPIMLAASTLARRLGAAMNRVSARRVAGLVVLAFGVWNTAGLAGQVGLVHTQHACCAHR